MPIEEITRHHIEAFFSAQTKVSNKTILNYHVGLSALWTWAVSEHIVPKHIVREVTPPKPEQKEFVPFSVVEIRAMFSVVGRDSKGHILDKRMKYTADRNRTIKLLLLDTGMRASELFGLNFSHVDTHNRRVRVMGKGAKERTIPFSTSTGQALWRYLTARPDVRANNDPLIATQDEHELTRSRLLKILFPAPLGRFRAPASTISRAIELPGIRIHWHACQPVGNSLDLHALGQHDSPPNMSLVKIRRYILFFLLSG